MPLSNQSSYATFFHGIIYLGVDFMNKLDSKNLYTSRLELRLPTMKEQHRLWEILIDETVNRYYFPTPDRIFIKNNQIKKSNLI